MEAQQTKLRVKLKARGKQNRLAIRKQYRVRGTGRIIASEGLGCLVCMSMGFSSMSHEARHRVKGVRGICAGVTGAGHQYSGD